MYIHTDIWRLRNTCLSIYVCMHVCMYLYTCVCMYVYLYILFICIYYIIYIYIMYVHLQADIGRRRSTCLSTMPTFLLSMPTATLLSTVIYNIYVYVYVYVYLYICLYLHTHIYICMFYVYIYNIKYI